MNKTIGLAQEINRRHFLQATCGGLGAAALGMLGPGMGMAAADAPTPGHGAPHFAPKAKRIIYLFQSGAPSQLETFDYKPGLQNIQGTDLPSEIRMGQRLTGMTSRQDKFPVLASKF